MIIHVFDGDHSRPSSSCELRTAGDLDIVLVTTGSARNLLELDQTVRSIDPSIRRSAHRFIFRLPAQSQLNHSSLIARDDLPILSGRLEGIPFSFLSRGDERSPQFILHSDDVPARLDEASLLPALRTAELRSLLRQPGVELPAVPDFHYRGPNGRHYQRFLRIGFAMDCTAAIDSLLFWVEEHLIGSSTLIVDTGGILTFAYAARALRPELSVCSLSGYSEELPRLHSDAGPDATLLISVSSTGAMASRIKRAWREQHGGKLRVVSLFGYEGFVPDEGDTLVCKLEEELAHYSKEDCPSCKEEKPSPAIPIDPHTYLLEIGGAIRPSKIREEDASEGMAFFKRYGGAGAVQLHRNDDSGRHHMVYVDIAPLITHQTFLDRLSGRIAEINEKRRVRHVLCPTHANAVALARLVTAELGLAADDLVIADEREAERLAELANKRKGGAHCLVVDDVLISGHRIRGYKNALHGCGFDFGRAELSFLVGIDRSPSADDRTKVKNMLDRGASFFPIESLILPHWGATKCPWCREFQAIKRTMQAFADDEEMRHRFHQIEQPIIADPFLPGIGGVPQSLGKTSVFLPPTGNAVEIFASVASAIQRLRSIKHLNEHRDIPVARILQNEFTFKGRYYDTTVTASILRASSDHDLRTFTVDPELKEEFSIRLSEAGGAELYGEILFACSRGIIPTPDNAVAAAAAIEREHPGIGKFLRLLNKL